MLKIFYNLIGRIFLFRSRIKTAANYAEIGSVLNERHVFKKLHLFKSSGIFKILS